VATSVLEERESGPGRRAQECTGAASSLYPVSRSCRVFHSSSAFASLISCDSYVCRVLLQNHCHRVNPHLQFGEIMMITTSCLRVDVHAAQNPEPICRDAGHPVRIGPCCTEPMYVVSVLFARHQMIINSLQHLDRGGGGAHICGSMVTRLSATINSTTLESPDAR
jgi:hypothetical protein